MSTRSSTRQITKLERDLPRALRAYCDELDRMGMTTERRRFVRALVERDERFEGLLGG